MLFPVQYPMRDMAGGHLTIHGRVTMASLIVEEDVGAEGLEKRVVGGDREQE